VHGQPSLAFGPVAVSFALTIFIINTFCLLHLQLHNPHQQQQWLRLPKECAVWNFMLPEFSF